MGENKFKNLKRDKTLELSLIAAHQTAGATQCNTVRAMDRRQYYLISALCMCERQTISVQCMLTFYMVSD